MLPGTELPALPVWLVAARGARKPPQPAAVIQRLRSETEAEDRRPF